VKKNHTSLDRPTLKDVEKFTVENQAEDVYEVAINFQGRESA